MAKVTPWYPASIHPVRRGVYQRDHGPERHYRFRYSHWNGQRWGGWAESVKAAAKNKRWPSERQSLPWRGLVKLSPDIDCGNS